MNIIAINGSPRGTASTTFVMVEEFLRGAESAGAKTQHILLAGKKIGPCTGCLTCWKNSGQCVQKDDMENFPSLECDVLVLASPLYTDSVTAIMKIFLERRVARANPMLSREEGKETEHPRTNPAPKLVVISNCGFPEQTQFEAMQVFFRRYARNLQTEVIGEIYRGEGPLLLRKEVPAISKYKELLRTCGREIVTDGSLCSETKEKLEEPLIPYDLYVKLANEHHSS